MPRTLSLTVLFIILSLALLLAISKKFYFTCSKACFQLFPRCIAFFKCICCVHSLENSKLPAEQDFNFIFWHPTHRFACARTLLGEYCFFLNVSEMCAHSLLCHNSCGERARRCNVNLLCSLKHVVLRSAHFSIHPWDESWKHVMLWIGRFLNFLYWYFLWTCIWLGNTNFTALPENCNTVH